MRRVIFLLLAIFLAFGLAGCAEDGDDGEQGPQGEQGPAGEPGPGAEPTTSVETCVGCHGPNGVEPVADIDMMIDAHHVDLDMDGPSTPSGYRSLVVTITEVDVTGSTVVIEFDVEDEDGDPVDDLFAGDGRFTIAQLVAGADGDPDSWVPFITRIENPGVGPGTDPATQGTAEGFSNGTFENLEPGSPGSYRYTSSFDPTSVPIMDGDTVRVAIQISAGDIPAGNGWCDFDADTSSPNDCVSGTTLTRDIVQTSTCNGCHGVTSDTQLALHGGGRTNVEYCVTCHNPTTADANSGNSVDMALMIHKIHRGAELENGYMIYGFRNSLHDYSNVNFIKDIDDCTTCHTGGGADVDNWSMVPTIEACGSCHDDVNFASGANHVGGAQSDNRFCTNCHPATGPLTAQQAPVETVHRGVARRMEGALYADGDGYRINDVQLIGDDIVIDWEVRKDGAPMDIETAPEWNAGGGASRLAFAVGWPTSDYTNEDSGAGPGLPFSINALDFTNNTVAIGGNEFRSTAELPGGETGTIGVGMEGHPAADLDGDGTYSDRIAVKNAIEFFDVEGGRSMAMERRAVVDVEKCNQCHDSSGNGISLHGQNRTGEIQVCVLCHTANATDINRRPADPMDAIDGKREEAIDFKRMIHQIHAGAELEEGIVVYGFGNTAHDFSSVEFIGNLRNCETCHLTPGEEPGAYGAVAASEATPTTIDSGADVEDPGDDLNISPTASVCSACHDSEADKDHMKLHGASFQALDDDIL